ncbi:histidine kinase [Dyadobacter sp. 676]|uniref:Histidine kinase n=1 Tax=Dyadobacter sp. 676 TaxID=3088362 RepID=A0AAU8FNN3_9BACT
MRHFQVFWLIYLLWPLTSSAQFIFQNLKEEDGLSSKDIHCMYKDTDGFLWIGTVNGLNRYDGNTIKCYDDLRAVHNVEVNGIYPVDGNANLLVATSRGLKLFNKSAGRYQTDQRWKALTHMPLLAIKEDGEKRIWFIGKSEIFVYDGVKVWKLTDLFPWARRVADHDLSFAAKSAFCWDKKRKGFWVGGYDCLFIDCGNKTVYDSKNNPHKWPILNQRQVTAITLDNNDDLWYGSTIDFSLHFSKPDVPNDTSYLHLDNVRSTDGVNFLFVDGQDRVWISTWMYAAYLKEPGKPIRKLPYSQDAAYSIGYGFFNEIIEDDEKDIWFGTINGLSKLTYNNPFEAVYKLPSRQFFLQVNFAGINALATRGDTILALKEDGLVLFKQSEKIFRQFIGSKDILIRNRLSDAALSEGVWWIAGNGGLYTLRSGDQSLRPFTHSKLKKPFSPGNFVVIDLRGRIWFQVWKEALYRFDPKTNICERIDGTDDRWGRFRYKPCQSALKLRNGDLLFAMKGEGILRFSERTQQFNVIEVADKKRFHAMQMIEDQAGNWWAAVLERGLFKLNERGQYIDSLTRRNGFVTTLINSIALDNRGAIWAAGPTGLLFFFPETKKVTQVKINLGKTLQDYWNYVLATRDRVYAAMLDHVVVIDPMKFARIPVKNAPQITSIKVFGNEISDFPPPSLILGPTKDFITFQFASWKHRDIPSLQYSYQLEGIDENWVNAGRNLSVSYNSLAAGDYVFKVRSTNEHEQWMNQYTTLKIRIMPYWWQSWWFFLLVGCVSGAFLYLTYHGYLNRKHKRELTKTIEYFVNSIYGENSVSEICWDIVRSCTSQLHFEDCTVFLWDEDRQKLLQKATYGSKDPIENELLNPLELELGEGIVGVAAKIRKTLIIPDTSLDPRYIRQDPSKFSEIAVPILHEGKLIGVLDSEHSKKNFFTEEQARTLVTIASINANKIAEAQAEEEAAKKEIMLLEINRMLAESQLMALRAQMNPHFVFNCLNSIQECIVTQKYGEASKYLNKFSKLFRMVLNNSDRNLVTVEEEKDVLELYLELEQMRFEQSFVYSIDIDDELEADDILLPSMLLQPYVENAIWHGLMHKDGYRELKISFDRIDEEVFKCTIDDNGIGRRKSFEIKQKNAHTKRHKSKGLQIAKDRLDLIDRQGQHASVEIIDKYDCNDRATGTKVVIELSTSLDT